MRRHITPDCDAPDPSQRAVRPPQEGTPSGRYRREGGAYAVLMVPHPSAPLRGLPKEGGYALRGVASKRDIRIKVQVIERRPRHLRVVFLELSPFLVVHLGG